MSKNLKTASIIIIVAVFFVADRLVKWLFINLWRRAEFPLFGDWLKLKLFFNPGLAFGLPANYWLAVIFTVLAVLALVYLAYGAYLKNKFWELAAYSLVIAGAASNLSDRLRNGAVVDYFDVKYFTVFNLADVYITVGLAVIFVFLSVRAKKRQ